MLVWQHTRPDEIMGLKKRWYDLIVKIADSDPEISGIGLIGEPIKTEQGWFLNVNIYVDWDESLAEMDYGISLYGKDELND